MTQQSAEPKVQHVATEVPADSPPPADAAGAQTPDGQPDTPAAPPADADPPPDPADSLPAPQPGQPTTGSAQLVPVAESIRYRRRAQQAERRLAELQQTLDQRQQAEAALRAELADARRRAELTGLLAARGVVDLDAAVVLAEQRLAGAGDRAAGPARRDALTGEQLVEQLLKDKPYLLAASRPAEPDAAARPASATMGTPTQGRRARTGGMEMLRSAAQRASGTGRGPELETYLRLRRRAR